MRIPMLLLWGILTNRSQRNRYELLLSAALLIACGLVGSMAIVFPIVQYAVIALFLIIGKASERATKWSGKLLLGGNAVDAEANDAMRFHGLTQLIWFARIAIWASRLTSICATSAKTRPALAAKAGHSATT